MLASPTLRAPRTDLRILRDAGIAASGALVLFASTITANYALAHDSIAYLLGIEAGTAEGLLHPHHLLYNVLAALWLGAARAVGLGADGFATVSLLNSLAGAASVGFVFALLRARGGVSRGMAFAGAALVAGSFGFWFYSTTVEVYLLPLCALLAALYVVTGPRLTVGVLAGVGVLHGAAMVLHQAHVLFGVVVLTVLWARRDALAAGWPRGLAAYLGGGTVVVATAYGAAFAALGLGSAEEIGYWFTRYAHNEDFWNGLGLGTVAKAGVGFTRSFVGMHFAFALEPAQALMQRAFPDKFLTDEVFLVRSLSPAAATALLAAAAAIGAAIVGAFALGLRRVRRLGRERAVLALGVAVWLGVYAAFFLFWEPHNVEFWIPQSACVWLLIVLMWSEPRGVPRRRVAFFAALAALLVAVNFWGTIRPALSPASDLYRHTVEPLAAAAAPGDLVVLGRSHLLEGYVAYLSDARTLAVDRTLAEATAPDAAVVALRREIDAARTAGQAILVPRSAVEPEPQLRLRFGDTIDGVLDALWAPYRSAWAEQRAASGGTFYRIPPTR